MVNSSESLSSSSWSEASLRRAYLVRRSKGEYGSVYELDRTRRMGIGRSNSNFIVINDDGCSRYHAEIYFADGHWRIGDLGSLNGTRVNEIRIKAPTSLKAGDKITIGQVELAFVEDLAELKPQEVRRPAASDDLFP